jgi:1-acyl-sn-glycerol-3-phosphate acyltransferase
MPVSAVSAALVVGVTRLLCAGQARWRGCEPSLESRIYFANHTSHLDFVVLWAALPPEVRRSTRPVAARDYWMTGALRRYLALQVFRAVLVDRPPSPKAGAASPAAGPSEDRRSRARLAVEACAAALDDGSSLILFPEGTRGDGLVVAPFKPGLYHLSRLRPHVPLVPVFLENLARILPKGEHLPVPLSGSVVFGEPMAVGSEEPRDIFLARARESLLALSQPAATEAGRA